MDISWILLAPSEENSCQDRKTSPRASAHYNMAIERKILTNFHLGKSYIIYPCSLLWWWFERKWTPKGVALLGGMPC